MLPEAAKALGCEITFRGKSLRKRCCSTGIAAGSVALAGTAGTAAVTVGPGSEASMRPSGSRYHGDDLADEAGLCSNEVYANLAKYGKVRWGINQVFCFGSRGCFKLSGLSRI